MGAAVITAGHLEAGVAGLLGRAAVLADQGEGLGRVGLVYGRTLRILSKTPLFNRYTATKPIRRGFLAFLNRYIGVACSGLKSGRSARGCRRVAV